jgi:hypothetical protein
MMTLAQKKAKAKELQNELSTWVYQGRTEKPPILEEAWILHSHIEWKKTEGSTETLWEDLPYTDPALITFLISENEEGIMPHHTVKKLHDTLIKLEKLGIKIQEEFFSLNWSKNNKRHGARRSLELKKNNKPYRSGKKERLKPLPEGKEKIKKRPVKKPSKGFLLGLFGL